MEVLSRRRRRFSVVPVCTLLALILSLAFAFSVRLQTYAAGEPLTQISSDPFTNTDSNHKTEVEPDTFAFGNTVVSAFQVGRFFDGGASDIGWATSTNGGETWAHGFLPNATVNSTPPGKYLRASDASVAYYLSPRSGIELSDQLHTNKETRHVPTIVLSDQRPHEVREITRRGLLSLGRPFELTNLLALVDRTLHAPTSM